MKQSSLLIASMTGLLLSVSVFASGAHAEHAGGTGTCTGDWIGHGRNGMQLDCMPSSTRGIHYYG